MDGAGSRPTRLVAAPHRGGDEAMPTSSTPSSHGSLSSSGRLSPLPRTPRRGSDRPPKEFRGLPPFDPRTPRCPRPRRSSPAPPVTRSPTALMPHRARDARLCREPLTDGRCRRCRRSLASRAQRELPPKTCGRPATVGALPVALGRFDKDSESVEGGLKLVGRGGGPDRRLGTATRTHYRPVAGTSAARRTPARSGSPTHRWSAKGTYTSPRAPVAPLAAAHAEPADRSRRGRQRLQPISSRYV